jgi:CheY-like chemotaxis protein
MDDHQMVRETMRRQLVVLGFEVAVAAEGREAVALHEKAIGEGAPFDAVVLDLRVDGGWGGEETLAELRRLNPGVKAMVCSAALAASPDAYLRKGFRAVLSKPYSIVELQQKLETTLFA